MVKYIFLIIGVLCVLSDTVLMYLIHLANLNKFSMMSANSMNHYFSILNGVSFFALIFFFCLIDKDKGK